MSSENEPGQRDHQGEIQSAGVVRVFARSFFGLFPKHLPYKSLGKLTERADVVTHFSEAKESKYSWKALGQATKGLIRTSILGTLLFTSYDYASGHSFALQTSIDQNDSLRETFRRASLGGAFAGACHGLGSFSWNKIFSPKDPCFLGGTLVTHSLVHLSLFSSYEVSKTFLMKTFEFPYHSYGGACSVMTAGALSAVCMETMTHYVISFEDEGFNRQTLQKLKATKRPPLRTIFAPSVLIPTMIGFLAYEYTREAVLKLSKKKIKEEQMKE